MKVFLSFSGSTRKFLAILVVFAVSLPSLIAQTPALEIETLLDTKAVTYAQAARFVLEAADQAALADQAEAFRFAAEKAWLPKTAEAQAEARLNGIALLIMKSFNYKGGLFYTIFKNPHYAYRELVYKEIIQGRSDPDMTVSGNQLLFMVGRILSGIEDKESAVASEARLRAEEERLRVEEERLRAEEERLKAEAERLEAERLAQQEALAAQINTQLTEMAVPDTSAQVTTEGVTIRISNIQFLADSAVLAESEKVKLDEIAEILSGIEARRINIAGHSALAGTTSGQQELSYDRARTVAAYLISLGARKSEDITVQGFGAERPIADNGTDEGRAINRRVEIIILENQQ